MATSSLTIAQKKDYAKTLFVREKLTQKECAKRSGVTEKTLGKWVEEGGWRKLQQNIILTREEQMQSLMQELEELNNYIKTKPEGFRFADSKEGDVRRKLIKDIKELETKASLAELIEAGRRFLQWLRTFSADKGKEVANLYDSFLKENLK